MENKDVEAAQGMLDEKMMDIEKRADDAPYQALELRLTDKDGNVQIKGTMTVANMMALEELQGMSKGEVMQMFYFALEDDLNNKNNEKD